MLLLCITTSVFAKNIVEEGYLIFDRSKKSLSIFKNHPDLTIDHITPDGYEVYGPKKLALWLETLDIPYVPLMKVSEHPKLAASYPTPEEIADQLTALRDLYPHIIKLISIGKSHRGRDLWVVKISDNPELDELEPEFKYIANMHGDEIVGRELMLRLIKDMAEQYNKDPYITQLINATEIFIMPSMNPDGADNKRRGNQRSVDLNRDFPDFTTRDNRNRWENRELETQAVMQWQSQRNFSLSANFHGGTEVVNYPWDTHHLNAPNTPLIIQLSKSYASLVPSMARSTQFPGGIVNGYKWYEVNGGMQDWSYYWYNDLQVTIELSHAKWPRYSMIDEYYKKNRQALLSYIGKIHQGFGIKLNEIGLQVNIQQIVSKNLIRNIGEFSTATNEFHKVLLPGEYMIKVTDRTGQVWTFEQTISQTFTPTLYNLLN